MNINAKRDNIISEGIKTCNLVESGSGDLTKQDIDLLITELCIKRNLNKSFLETETKDDGSVVYHFYTDNYRYQIVVVDTPEKNYLGAQVSCRKAKLGETHLRGSDLPDSKLNLVTWVRILASIINNELI